MAPRSPQPRDCSGDLRDVAWRVFHELRSSVPPPPTVATFDHLDQDRSDPDAVRELLVHQGILCCRQIHSIGSTGGPPDEELAFLNLSMLDVVLNRITELGTAREPAARLENGRNVVQDLMLRIGKDFGTFDDES